MELQCKGAFDKAAHPALRLLESVCRAEDVALFPQFPLISLQPMAVAL